MIQKEFLEQLSAILPENAIYPDEPMSRHTTFRIGGSADVLVTPDITQAAEIRMLCKKMHMPLTVIGNGSNLLVGDKGIRGCVMEFTRPAGEILVSGEQITVQAGVLLSKAAAVAAEHDLTGLEFAAGIPGTIGGAVVMNAGAYGGEMKDIILDVDVLTKDGEKKTIPQEALDLSYRHSCIPKEGYFVLSARLQLKRETGKKSVQLWQSSARSA